MKIALIASAAALASVTLAACGETKISLDDSYDSVAEREARETPDYRFAPPLINPDLSDIPPPLSTTPQPDSTNPVAPPPASPPPPMPGSVPG